MQLVGKPSDTFLNRITSANVRSFGAMFFLLWLCSLHHRNFNLRQTRFKTKYKKVGLAEKGARGGLVQIGMESDSLAETDFEKPSENEF